MSRRAWEVGNGAHLPNGTWAWIAVRITSGLAAGSYYKTIERRRDAGWGTNGDPNEHREGPMYYDEGQDPILAACGYEPLRVTHYQILEVPDDPP